VLNDIHLLAVEAHNLPKILDSGFFRNDTKRKLSMPLQNHLPLIFFDFSFLSVTDTVLKPDIKYPISPQSRVHVGRKYSDSNPPNDRRIKFDTCLPWVRRIRNFYYGC